MKRKRRRRTKRFNMNLLVNPNNPSPDIIFEFSDIRRDTGLLLLKRKDSKFKIHLHNDYTNDAIATVLSIEDLAKMFDSLEDNFIKSQTADVYE
jgi:hypothetical protein